MALSIDLRTRLLAAVDSGSSCRAAADRFGVARQRLSAAGHSSARWGGALPHSWTPRITG